MEKTGKSRKKKIILILVSVMLCAALVLGGLMIYGKAQMQKIPGLTYEDALRYTTKGRPDARITVGVIRDGQAFFTVYGEDGQVLPKETHVYEIGSLTKTFTAALIARAVTEGRIRLDDTIDAYLSAGAVTSNIEDMLHYAQMLLLSFCRTCHRMTVSRQPYSA